MNLFAIDVYQFSRQISGMAARLSQLLDTVNVLPDPTPIAVDTFKELGVATEELQVAMEEMQQQNETLNAALESVAEERKRYQNLFQFAPQAYLVTSLEGKIQEANWMATQLLGVPTEFLIGKPLLVFIAGADRSTYWAELARRQQRDYRQEWECWLQPRHQKLVAVACSIMAIREQDGQAVGFRWALRDITEQKQLERLEQDGYDFLEDSEAVLEENHSLQTYKQGEVIPLVPQTLWYVIQGLVKLTSFTLHNKEMMIGLVKPGMPFGAYLTELPVYQATALSDVKLVSVPLNRIATSHQLAQLLFAKTSQRLRQTEALLLIQGEQSVETGLQELQQLLKAEMGEPVESGVRLTARLTHEDLASACGSTRATITRLLGKLERQGKIKFDDKRHIMVMDDR